MVDFYYYLNRQGIRGLQGIKGDQGDSPIITVQTETPNEYILKITNPDGAELISPNLRGNKININEGTYVRYNTDTGELYTSTADGATGELAGVVRLATDVDITNMDERSAVTPSQLADALSQYLVSPNGSVHIVQNTDTSLTELTVVGGLTDVPIASADTLGVVKIGENLSITEDGTLSANGGSGGTTDYTQLENKPQINSVELTGNKTLNDLGIQAKGDYLTALPDNAVTTDTDQTISGAKTFTQGITATNIFPSGTINFSGTSGAINSCKQIAGGYGASSYIDLSDMMDIIGRTSLTLKGGTGGLKLTAASSSSITCENTLIAPEIRTTTNKKYLTEEDVDNQTIQIVEGKLHANLDELGNEVNILSDEVTDLSGRVTVAEADILKKQNKLTAGSNIILTDLTDGTVRIDSTGGGGTGDIPIATTTTAGKVKPDGTTITITDDGTISAVGGGGSGATIDDSTTATTSVWSSSKTNTEINTAVDAINSTKNNNIFDIGKFTVVGSPTITNDGIASGFSSNDYVTSKYNLKDGKIYTFVVEGIGGTPRTDRGSYIFSAFYRDSSGDDNLRLIVGAKTGIVRFALGPNGGDIDTKFAILNGVKYKIELKTDFKTFVTFTDLLTGYTLTKTGYSITDQTYGDMVINYGTKRGASPLTNGSIDLKQFSITVDGKEVFNGLMSSTKPIYDAIKANNTELSEFKTETSTDFSAVNSALNEKANLSDLSKCASLADFNRLSATVTALESQVGDVSAVLDNINGEVI